MNEQLATVSNFMMSHHRNAWVEVINESGLTVKYIDGDMETMESIVNIEDNMNSEMLEVELEYNLPYFMHRYIWLYVSILERR